MSKPTFAPVNTEKSLAEEKLSKKNPTLKDIMDVLRDIRVDGSRHDKKLDSLNRLFTELCKKYKKLEATVSSQQVVINTLKSQLSNYNDRMVHLSNDAVDAENCNRLNSVIFTGMKSRPTSKCIDVQKEIKDMMEILEIRTFQVKNYEFIPWGSAYSMKCTFSSHSTCGHILRNSYRHKKYTANTYNVRPDLSAKQRSIREKLVILRKEIESSSKAKCSLKSWRYLVVAYHDGKHEYYEADYYSKPQKIQADLIPLNFRLEHCSIVQPATPQDLQQFHRLPCTSTSVSSSTKAGATSSTNIKHDNNSSFTSISM